MPFDVFLSHNSLDKPFVRAVAGWFDQHGVSYFLDENELEPGDCLTDKLGAAMDESRAAIVFIGPDGEGPWMREEVNSLLNRAIKLSRQKDEFRIIPMLLPNADTTKLRWFLQTCLWVDLSKGVTDNDAELFRLRQAILGRADGSAIPGDADFNPYKGLSAFQFKDADFFFGRAQACRDLAAKLREWRFACVVGPSGNGKSSLARAGLATDAAEDAFPGIRSFKRVTLVPGANLLRAFVEQLAVGLPDAERADRVARAMDRIDPKGQNPSATEWADRLNDELRAWFPEPQQCVLLLVDQFEEVFTQRGLVAATDAEREERIHKILDCLAVLATQGDKRWHFVLTLRNDLYQRCRVSGAFWKLVSADRLSFPLDELDEEGWREAIKGPAARAGAYLEAGLVATTLKDVYRQRGSMPLLQLALHQLWRLPHGACLTHAAYTALGGVSDALQVRAESALKHLQDEKPEYLGIARNLFLRLTALGEGVSDSRRRLDRSELDWENTDPQDIEHVLAELSNADNRLLVADTQSVEVTHEVLIRECDTIRGWVETARKEIPVLRRLTYSSRRWEESQRSPDWLNAADPPRELKQWATRTTLRLTHLEREYWTASRAQRLKDLREKRAQAQAILRSEQERLAQAQALLRTEQEKLAQAQALLRAEQEVRATAEVHAKDMEKSRLKTKRFAIAASVLAIVAVITTGVAVLWGFQASQARSSAQTALEAATNANLKAKQALRREKAASKAAQQALTRSFVRTIGTLQNERLSGDEVSGDEVEALWELAALEPDNEPVRKAVLTNWLQTLDLVLRALARDARGLHSAIGLNASLITNCSSRANAAASLLAAALEKPQEEDSFRLWRLGEALAALAGQMDGIRAAPVAARGALVLAKVLENPQEKDPERLWRSGEALAALAGRMDAANAAPVAEHIARALENPQQKDSRRLSYLRAALAAMAGRMDATNAAPVAERIARALENPQEKDPDRLWRLSEVLATMVGRMDGTNAAPVAERIARALKNPQENDFFRLWRLGEALAALAGRMDGTNAAPLAARGALVLAKALENPQEQDSDRLWRLGEALAALAGRMDGTNAAPLAARGASVLAKALEDPQEKDSHRLSSLGAALAALAGRMDGTNAAPLAARGAVVLAKVLENPQEKDSDGPWRLVEALAALATRMDGTNAASVAERIAKALENPQEKDSDRLWRLGDALAALATRMEGTNAASVAEHIAKALENPQEKDSDRLWRLGKALAMLARRMDGTNAASVAARGALVLAKALENPQEQDSDRLWRLGEALAALVTRMDGTNAASVAERIAKALENPQAKDSHRLWMWGAPLASLGAQFPAARQTQFAALSFLMLKQVSPPPGEGGFEAQDRATIAEVCSLLATNVQATKDLVEVLKWPVCVGEAQKLVLAELGRRTGQDFGGDVRKFVEQVNSRRISGVEPRCLELPPKRPQITNAVEELEVLIATTTNSARAVHPP